MTSKSRSGASAVQRSRTVELAALAMAAYLRDGGGRTIMSHFAGEEEVQRVSYF